MPGSNLSPPEWWTQPSERTSEIYLLNDSGVGGQTICYGDYIAAARTRNKSWISSVKPDYAVLRFAISFLTAGTKSVGTSITV